MGIGSFEIQNLNVVSLAVVFAHFFGLGFQFFKFVSVRLRESFGKSSLLFVVVARVSFVGCVALPILSLAHFLVGRLG